MSTLQRLRVTTWNVLHRVHAVNWKEEPVLAFPDERVRIEEISSLVARWLASHVDAVCLQEVSGDQLAGLRLAVGSSAHVFEHLYPRLPRIRGSEPLELRDATEHLVTLVKEATDATDATAPSARQLDARTFDTDPGKGLLAVDVRGHAVINTHVSAHERRDAQLAVLSVLARAAPNGAIALGDFNAPADVVRGALGEGVVIADLTGQRPTRMPTAEHGGRTIDHVAVVGGTLESATVLDAKGLSDHNPVTAVVLFG